MRRFVDLVVGCGVLALLVDTWLVQGLLAPVIVTSGSMAPALLGPRRLWRCSGCGHQFACNLESLPRDETPVMCPNCGDENPASTGALRRGQRVWIDRSAFLWRSPRRWEVVALRCPEDAGTTCVKRIAGLPGETVQIRDGDLFVGGAIARKNLPQQRSLAVSVHHASAADPCWQATTAGTWQWIDAQLVHRARPTNRGAFFRPSPHPEPIEWLAYRHQQRLSRADRLRPAPIRDASWYDPSESRTLMEVADIGMRCEIRAAGEGVVKLRASCAGQEFTVQLNVETGKGELLRSDQVVAPIAAPGHPFRRFAEMEFMLADRRVQLAINGRALAQYDYEIADAEPLTPEGSVKWPAGEPLAIGAQGAEVEIRDLQVLRDVYYTPGPRGTEQTVYELEPDEYLVLGDNSPHASDSRDWSPSGLPGGLLIGRVLAW